MGGWPCGCSIKEPGLYDYIIFNDDVEEAFRQLASVTERALRGQVCRPIHSTQASFPKSTVTSPIHVGKALACVSSHVHLLTCCFMGTTTLILALL